MMLAIDIGGTKIAAALIDEAGLVTGSVAQVPTPARADGAAVMRAAVELAQQLTASTRATTSGSLPLRIAVSAAGVIDAEGIVVSSTSSISGWTGTDVRRTIANQTGIPGSRVTVVGDGHAFGVGEAVYGAGRGHHRVLVLAAGTGIGGAHVVGGTPWAGRHGAAGHFGHVSVAEAAGVTCPCGARGHVEAVAGGAGILSWYHAHGGAPEVDDTRHLFTRPRDELARAAIELGATALGAAASSLSNALDPDIVVVAGGLAAAGPVWESPLRAGFRAGLMPVLSQLELIVSHGGAATALVGAAHVAMKGEHDHRPCP